MRPIWTGSIGFGLVNIPVKLYSATEESNLPFFTLDKNNHARIKYKKVNEITGKEVPPADIVKGFKIGKDVVIVEDEDFQKAMPEKYDHLEIVQFISEKEIDAVYFEKPYYLEPDKSGGRAYALLRDALKKSDKAGVGLFVMHKREHVAIIKALDDVLVLNRIRFPQEIRSHKDLKLPKDKPKPNELKMATSLIDQLTEPFDPKKYHDDYTGRLMKIIEAKAKGKKTPFKPMKVVHSKTADLMDQLKASLSGSKRRAS